MAIARPETSGALRVHNVRFERKKYLAGRASPDTQAPQGSAMMKSTNVIAKEATNFATPRCKSADEVAGISGYMRLLSLVPL